ncbi:hypothetical protein [Weissella minor]|uniref:Phage protein n=1 Tax=Weissella minor TaxID=1620 RepID=A0A0R2JRM4_9LACO|nr:hypothetical protein [Weissella minor]KRN77612.1 hypothetical protein IV67_GL001456 [Weissella minor]
MTLQEELKNKANKKFDEFWDEIKGDLEKAAENWETLSYEKNTSEDRLFNFVMANKGKFEKEGIIIEQLDLMNKTVTLNWM